MSAISGFINQIQNAVYGEQVRSAIIDALQACYSDVENPDLQSAAFQTAIENAYEDGILDITTVTSFNDMTNQNIIYRYNGTAAGKQKGLYYYSALSSSWVLIGSEIQKVSLASQMTDVNDIYKYIGTESGMVQNSLYCHNGTSWVPIGSGLLTASTASQMTNTEAIYKYTGNETGYVTNGLYYYNGSEWVIVGGGAIDVFTPTKEGLVPKAPSRPTTSDDPMSVTGYYGGGTSEDISVSFADGITTLATTSSRKENVWKLASLGVTGAYVRTTALYCVAANFETNRMIVVQAGQSKILNMGIGGQSNNYTVLTNDQSIPLSSTDFVKAYYEENVLKLQIGSNAAYSYDMSTLLSNGFSKNIGLVYRQEGLNGTVADFMPASCEEVPILNLFLQSSGNWASLSSVSDWYGKSCYAYGTSLTAYGKFTQYLAPLSGMTITNKGIGGGKIVGANANIKSAVMNTTDGKTNADLILLEVGANDTSEPLGTIYDTGDTTFCGALNQCIRYLQENTNAQIVVMSSTNSRYSGSASNPTPPENTYGSDSHTKFDQWEATRKVCEVNSCYYIPMGEGCGLGFARMSDDYISDQIHFTNLGGYNIAQGIWSRLKNIPLWYTQIPS